MRATHLQRGVRRPERRQVVLQAPCTGRGLFELGFRVAEFAPGGIQLLLCSCDVGFKAGPHGARLLFVFACGGLHLSTHEHTGSM